MNIHEYQAKEIFRSAGIPVSKGILANNVEEAIEAYKKLCEKVVIKAQVHAGGRGKAGGIKIANNVDEVKTYTEELLDKVLVTKQTGSEGKLVKKVYIEEASEIKHELYLSLAIDSAIQRPVVIASNSGGMDIETVAKEDPSKIVKVEIDPQIGLRNYQALDLADEIELDQNLKKDFAKVLMKLYQLFMTYDCSMIEINPLAITEKEELLAVDAKINFDSSGVMRHPEIKELRDRSEEIELEAEAIDYGMNYVQLDGNIGCMVIGAGLAMATMDAINYFGGSPANFMDCGGASKPDDSEKAFDMILKSENVEGILVNIFGGITQTDMVAEGILRSIRKNNPKCPIVIRLEGTNSDLANKMIKDSGFNIEIAYSLTEGAQKIIKLVEESVR